jgi:hypothetical protein
VSKQQKRSSRVREGKVMAIEKRENGWFVDGSGPYESRQAARDASADPEATYAENVAVSEALDGAEDVEAEALVSEVTREFPEAEFPETAFEREVQELTESVTRESAKDVRKRENIVYMALYANTAPARAYWRKLAESEGYEVPAEDATV